MENALNRRFEPYILRLGAVYRGSAGETYKFIGVNKHDFIFLIMDKGKETDHAVYGPRNGLQAFCFANRLIKVKEREQPAINTLPML